MGAVLEALRQLKQIHSALLKKSNRPRLSHTFLLKQFSNNSTIQKHLADMPKFSEYLLTHQENVESYQIRRLRNIAAQLCRSGNQIKKWKLIRLAGLRKKHLTEKIRDVIYQLEEGIES